MLDSHIQMLDAKSSRLIASYLIKEPSIRIRLRVLVIIILSLLMLSSLLVCY